MIPDFHEAMVSYLFLALVFMTSVVGFFHRSFYYANVFQPSQVFSGQRLWTLFSSALVHGSWVHLLVNTGFCLAFMTEVEYMLVDDFGPLWGRWYMVALVFAIIISCNLLDGFRLRTNHVSATAGLSALACAMAMFYFIYFPLDGEDTPSYIFPSFKAFHIALGLLVTFSLAAIFRIKGNQISHLAGCLLGMVTAAAIRPAWIAEMVSYLFTGN